MKEILEKSFDFSVRALELINYLKTENRPFPLAERFLSRAADIGITVRLIRGTGKQSFSDRYKQALNYLLEAEYLLEIMVKTGYLSEKQSRPMMDDCHGLAALITAQLQTDAAL